jgi:hypothetical protein
VAERSGPAEGRKKKSDLPDFDGGVDMREGTSDGSARVQDSDPLSCPISYFPGYGRVRESLLKFELIVM